MRRFAVSLNVSMGHEPMDSLNQSYITWCERCGICPILTPNAITNPVRYVEGLNVEGIVLTGGNDIGSSEEPRVTASESPQRDQAEKDLLRWAVDKDLPVFGICRGMQFINQFFGGNLSHDIRSSVLGCGQHVAQSHRVRILEKSVATYLKTDGYSVNSFHNHGIVSEDVAPVLRAFAVAEDGIVEGVLHGSRKVLGIQWHPERKGSTEEFDSKLVMGFLTNAFWQP